MTSPNYYCFKSYKDRRVVLVHTTAVTAFSHDEIDDAIATILPHAVSFDNPLSEERYDWITQNTHGLWMIWHGVRFEHESDAVMFRLFIT